MNEEIKGSVESVMLIDDNLIDLYILSHLIIKNNFGKKVLQYSSAIEALRYLQENQESPILLPNLIFVDIYMPGMSGFEFMMEYDELPIALKKHCKVFVISSSKDERDKAKAEGDKNILAMVEKPITKEFLNKLRDMDTPPFSKLFYGNQ